MLPALVVAPLLTGCFVPVYDNLGFFGHDGQGGAMGINPYAQGGYAPSMYGQAAYGQAEYGAAGYAQAAYAQAAYAQAAYAQTSYNQVTDPYGANVDAYGQSLYNPYAAAGYGQGYSNGYAQPQAVYGNGYGQPQAGYGHGYAQPQAVYGNGYAHQPSYGYAHQSAYGVPNQQVYTVAAYAPQAQSYPVAVQPVYVTQAIDPYAIATAHNQPQQNSQRVVEWQAPAPAQSSPQAYQWQAANMGQQPPAVQKMVPATTPSAGTAMRGLKPLPPAVAEPPQAMMPSVGADTPTHPTSSRIPLVRN
ncbi:hypothetical protein Mmc1_2347 [Magnetococcus marinus MC-1]|uniref:Uncharacterized protein n=2 Tax=Magnetococcus TaxID=162171 RepID=A0LA54_MAGMM|nr:hypothetical protein Mmc1_2347 [Magnetococcus marinus MC-1]